MFATLLGVMHHHNDLKQHNDCKICTIQASIANADTPVDVVYLTQLDVFHEAIFTQLFHSRDEVLLSTIHARAPPLFSC
ncbi:hypothetical protein [Sulfurimonas sp.]